MQESLIKTKKTLLQCVITKTILEYAEVTKNKKKTLPQCLITKTVLEYAEVINKNNEKLPHCLMLRLFVGGTNSKTSNVLTMFSS